jgi:hypothetical protein
MSDRERERFVAQTSGRTCIAYDLRPDGTLITPSFWRSALRPFRWIRVTATAGLATLLPFIHSACGEPKPGPILGKLVCPPPKNPPPKEDPTKKDGKTVGTPQPPPKGGGGSSR